MCECRSRINFLQAPLIKLKNCSEKFREREILNVIQELKHEKIRHLNYRRNFALGILQDGQDGQDGRDDKTCIFVDTIHILEKYTHHEDAPILEYRKLQKMIDHLKLYIQEEINFKNEYIKQYETQLKPFLEFNQKNSKLQTVSYLTGQDREKDRLEKIKKEKAKKNKRKTRN
jgi:hypothetical protein